VMQETREMYPRHCPMSTSMSAVQETRIIGLNDEIPTNPHERSQLGTFIRFNNSFADSTLSLSDTSTCGMSGDEWLQEESHNVTFEFEDFARIAGADICEDSLANHKTFDTFEDASIKKKKKEKSKRRTKKKSKQDIEVNKNRRNHMSRRSSWNGTEIPEDFCFEDDLNLVPLEIFQNSLRESTEEFADSQYFLPECEENCHSKASIMLQQDCVNSFRSMSTRTTLLDDTTCKEESFQDLPLNRGKESLSHLHSQQEKINISLKANSLHPSRASVLKEDAEKVKNNLGLSSTSKMTEIINVDERSPPLSIISEVRSHDCSIGSIQCGNNTQCSQSVNLKRAVSCKRSWKPLHRQKSSSTIDSSTSFTSQKSLVYVKNLKDAAMSWETMENYEMNVTKDCSKSGRSTIRRWKSGHFKSRFRDLDSCSDMVVVSTACMPQEATNITWEEDLDLEADLYLQLTAFGGVTKMSVHRQKL
jgi:hypothetical protein